MWVCSSIPYVSPRAAGQADAWTDEAAQAGRAGRQDLRKVTRAVPPAEVAAGLHLQPGEAAFVRSRTILLDDQPVELADSWYPAHVAEGTALAEPRKIKGGAVTLLASMGYTAHDVIEDVSAVLADLGEASDLAIGEGDPLIVLFRTVLDQSGEPFEVSVMKMVATDRRLRYRLTVG